MNNENLQEERIKEILNKWLQSEGWVTKVAEGNARGIDIEAKKDTKIWVIEVKGCGSRSQMKNNYFLAIIGTILQRMNDNNARYSIALPNLPKYRRLWSELPLIAKQRTQIDAIFVNSDCSMEFCRV